MFVDTTIEENSSKLYRMVPNISSEAFYLSAWSRISVSTHSDRIWDRRPRW